MGAVEKLEPALEPVAPETSMLTVIERVAMAPDADLEKLERLIELKERMAARDAKSVYDAAFAEMQAEIPMIPERGEMKIGGSIVKYPLWEDINDIMRPILARYGFGLSFRIASQESGEVTVVAMLAHRSGHREETAITMNPNKAGGANDAHKVGSAVTYAKRYAASALLNLTSGEVDDGGVAAGAGALISEEQKGRLVDLLEETGANVPAFLNYIGTATLDDLPEAQFGRALALLERKRAEGGAAK